MFREEEYPKYFLILGYKYLDPDVFVNIHVSYLHNVVSRLASMSCVELVKWCSVPRGDNMGYLGRYPRGIIIYKRLCIVLYGFHLQ
jgi:hypothetical protein